MTAELPIEQQISEVQRELALRRNVYPGLVSRGKMKKVQADLCMQRMTQVLETLMWVRDHRDTIVKLIKEGKQQ